MRDLAFATRKICDILKEEYNEVIYKAWLLFIETAQFMEDSIVITVPNQYIKWTLEERYISDVEDLFRKELDFSDLIIVSNTSKKPCKASVSLTDCLEIVPPVEKLKNIILTSTDFSVSL